MVRVQLDEQHHPAEAPYVREPGPIPAPPIRRRPGKRLAISAAYLGRLDEVQELYRYCELAPALSGETGPQPVLVSLAITHEYPVGQALEAFDVARNSTESGKVLLRLAF